MTSVSARAAFVESLAAAAHDAVQAAGLRELWLRLAGRTVCLRFAGDALVEPMSRAMAHRVVESHGAADLTVWLWDDVTTGTRMPPPPWTHNAYLAQGKVRGFFEDGVYAQLDGGSGVLTVLDWSARRGFFWFRDATRLPAQAAPLRAMLHLWFAELGQALVHAAAVGDEHGCVLLVGTAGVGKSSTAVACVQDGLRYLSDDYCVLTADDPYRVSSIYSSARLWPDSVAMLGVSPPDTAPEGKPVLYLHETAPEAVARESVLRGFVIPHVGNGSGSVVRPARPGATLTAAAPSTMLQLPGTRQSTLTMLASAVRSVPCWHLDLAPEPAATARAIREILSRDDRTRP